MTLVRLVAFDVDGVLTDGSIVYGAEHELQSFHVHDGAGIKWLLEADIAVTWISGRGCGATERRAAELGVRELHLHVGAKDAVLADVQERLGISPAETLAMGDDLPDFGMASRAELLVAPADAHAEVRRRADWVTDARGGRGAVREVAEALLEARGLLAERLERFGREGR